VTDQADISAANWAKSSFSSGGDNCVEVAFGGGETVGVRDSKAVPAPILAVSGEAFAAFLRGQARRAGSYGLIDELVHEFAGSAPGITGWAVAQLSVRAGRRPEVSTGALCDYVAPGPVPEVPPQCGPLLGVRVAVDKLHIGQLLPVDGPGNLRLGFTDVQEVDPSLCDGRHAVAPHERGDSGRCPATRSRP
jgi:hypothetical protein